jgi:hypothetical protein
MNIESFPSREYVSRDFRLTGYISLKCEEEEEEEDDDDDDDEDDDDDDDDEDDDYDDDDNTCTFLKFSVS